MSDSPIQLRPLPTWRDLPPTWDGLKVEWKGWTNYRTSMQIHEPDRCCEHCASVTEPSVNIGIVAPAQGATIEIPVTRKLPSGRIYERYRRSVPAHPYVRFAAFRCPDCRTDTVWDKETGEWWTLDESDYGDEGSTDPRLF